MAANELAQKVAAVRGFNRFYTRTIGVLEEGLLQSPFSLTEVRVLYEIAHRDKITAAELVRDLGLDAGYLSRLLRGLENRDLIEKRPSEADARQHLLSLTRQGCKTFRALDANASEQVGNMLAALAAPEQDRLVGAMQTVERLLGPRTETPVPYLLRGHRPGDMGWVVYRHGALYAQEYGLDERFEALVAEIVAKFLREFDPRREACWIAERDVENVGSVFLVKRSEEVAQLRLLLVEPAARGLGIGRRLVEECVRFARQTGYRKVMLWTQSVLLAAGRVYQAAGFRLVQEEPYRGFGPDLVSQTWELGL
jgi:DNA-binding MarR family transcriptional regulator/GNAT superfamily N-acetyltransferase